MIGIGKYVGSVITVCLCCAIFRRLAGEKSSSAFVINTLCGIVVTVSVLTLLFQTDKIDVDMFIKNMTTDADTYIQAGVDQSNQQMQSIITEKVRAYILEKASYHSCNLTEIDVRLSTEQLATPEYVKITGSFSPNAKQQLSEWIALNLGIPKEKQEWIYQN